MMEGVIAVNTKHTGDPGKDHRGYAEPMTSEQVDRLLSEGWLKAMVTEIRSGNEKLKDQLPFVCPHYVRFRNNHRAQSDIIPEAFTFMTCVDVDDKSLVEEAIKRTQELIANPLSDWQELILRMDYSARKKLHIWLCLPVGKTISETQEAFCKEIGIPYDESCTTPERFIYLTGIEEEIYRSELWLKPLSEAELEERREVFLNRGLDVDGRKMRQGHTQGTVPAVNATLSQGGQSPCAALSPCKANERTRFIFQECLKECDLEPDVLVVEGARHDAVKSILSVGASQLMTKEEFLGVLSEMMPKNWQDKNIQDLVNDFYTKYYDPSQKLSQFQRRVFARSRKVGTQVQETDSLGASPYGGSTPPEMPSKLPKLIQLLTSKTPAIYKATVAHAVFPPLATHLKDVNFTYTDNVDHEATLMNCLMAETSAGKSCIDEPIDHIMADIQRRDDENARREEEWKKDCNRKGANKDKMLRPEGLVIQIIDSDMTKPALVTRLKEAEGHFVYVKVNELDLFEQLKGVTGKQHFQVMCLAFDPKSTYGQTRIGTQSVTARPRCRFNWNASTTILKGRRFFQKVLTDGPISRINFCTIPADEIGADQPVFGKYDAAFDEALKPYIDNLCAAHGYIDCPQAFKLAKKLMQECAEFARLSQSLTYWSLSHRACIIAWLKACVLYVANGQKWEKSIEAFILWSLRYDMWCKMQFFGADIEKANNCEEARIGTHPGPRNLLELLPNVFTVEDAKRVRRQQGMTTDRTRNMISTWKKRDYVVQMADGSFKKCQQKESGN